MEDERRLRARLNKFKDQKATAIVNRTEAENEIKRLNNQISRVRKELTKKPERRVSDHAIVRYMERVMGINIKDLEKTIKEDDTINLIKNGGMVVTVTVKK